MVPGFVVRTEGQIGLTPKSVCDTPTQHTGILSATRPAHHAGIECIIPRRQDNTLSGWWRNSTAWPRRPTSEGFLVARDVYVIVNVAPLPHRANAADYSTGHARGGLW